MFRQEKLQEAHQFQLFKANQRLLLDWSAKQSSEMAEKSLPKSKAEAELLIVEHQDRKVSGLLRTCPLGTHTSESGNGPSQGEPDSTFFFLDIVLVQTEMDTRTARMDSVCQFGKGLIRSGHSSKVEIQEALSRMEKAKSAVEEAWLTRSSALDQAQAQQVSVQSSPENKYQFFRFFSS